MDRERVDREAMQRHAARRDALEHRVRIFSDHGASTPVWTSGLVTDLTSMGISPGLQARLRRAAEIFNDEVDWQSGWRSEKARLEHEQLLDAAVPDLAEELGPDYEVVRGSG